MSNIKFKPEKGEMFWRIEEIEDEYLSELQVIGEKFDPKNKDHKKASKSGKCFLTEDEAFEFLL